MTGLENILNQIESDAKSRADEILTEAQNEADGIISEAKAKSDEILRNFEDRAQISAKEIIDRGAAADEIKAKRAILRKKQELIKSAVDAAEAEIKSCSAEEYFKILEKILENCDRTCEGRVLLPEKDLTEMTPAFEKALKAKTLKAEVGNIASRNGFIIVCGSIEINCTVDAIFDAGAEEISDSLNSFLFGSEGGN